MSANSSSNAVRALDILLTLGEADADGLPLGEIANRVGEAKPAVHRSLASLIQKGFAEPAGRHGHYRLGPAITMLGRRQARLEPLIARHRPGMTEFARRTGYTVYMMVQAGVDAICAEMVSRSPQQQLWLGLGGRVPMGVAAGSVALLSMLPAAEYKQLIEANTERYIRHPSIQHVDATVVLAQVREAQRRGYATNMGYYHPGEGGIGLPVPSKSPHEMNVAISFTLALEIMTDTFVTSVVSELKKCLFTN
ncbi:helix-turn-helix domain-containing protein [Mesorhizobium sp.]|uniref:IclR family transcriptional regulator n=1 Tax=Mesorhizobium sp. TaxID=1871066 RepID=UPI000FE6323B|nr:helix-turn-helix domain-containing protein [Mesorhizobium sp.]RWI99727.1 MAG: IclR family transcriptional regulator [Mesorhizobium sp.]RWL96853.1 MAG: IclR family transcriptional regulator [Mesorhizobium sp.]RWO93065.1 MAG: IclR family transcriptional regulator [Mesorhizobium sp.]